MTQIAINLNTLKAVSKAMPKKDPRYVLLSVFVEVELDGNTTLTATDGKVMCSMSEIHAENEGIDASFMLPGSTVLDVVKRVSKATNPTAIIDTVAKQIKIMDGKPALLFEPVEGKYPNYRYCTTDYNLWPQKLTMVSLSAQVLTYLADLAKALNKPVPNVTLIFEAEDGEVTKPIVVASQEDNKAVGLVMPTKTVNARALESALWPCRIRPQEQSEAEVVAIA